MPVWSAFFLVLNIPEGKKFDKLMAGHTSEQQAEQQAAYISGYDMGVYDQGQKDNFTLDEAYVAVYDVAYDRHTRRAALTRRRCIVLKPRTTSLVRRSHLR